MIAADSTAGVIATFALMNAYWMEILQPHNIPNVDFIDTMVLWGSVCLLITQTSYTYVAGWWTLVSWLVRLVQVDLFSRACVPQVSLPAASLRLSGAGMKAVAHRCLQQEAYNNRFIDMKRKAEILDLLDTVSARRMKFSSRFKTSNLPKHIAAMMHRAQRPLDETVIASGPGSSGQC